MTSLFEKLGGKEALDAAVEIFYKKVMADDSVNHFFEKTNMPRQMAKMRVFLTYAFGGSPNYSGESMRKVHQNIPLTEDHFNAVAGHLKTTLQDLNVPDDLQDEVMTIAASTHDDVLNL